MASSSVYPDMRHGCFRYNDEGLCGQRAQIRLATVMHEILTLRVAAGDQHIPPYILTGLEYEAQGESLEELDEFKI